MDEASYGCDLVVEIPSPLGDPNRTIEIWFANDEKDISISFAGWHTHGNVAVETSQGVYKEWSIVDAAKMIVAGVLVGLSEHAARDDTAELILLPGDFQIEDALTSEAAPDKVFICSWDGTKDRKISAADLYR